VREEPVTTVVFFDGDVVTRSRRASCSAEAASIRCVTGGDRRACRYPRLVVEVTREEFESFVADAIDSIPEEFASKVDNVVFLVEDDSPQGNLLGLYEGVPTTKRWHYSGAMPDRITIYKDAICRISRTVDEVREQVRQTVVHELGHYFGLGDRRLRELGW
jgi:predicted Zn-dependent protease with MMP-like domain